VAKKPAPPEDRLLDKAKTDRKKPDSPEDRLLEKVERDAKLKMASKKKGKELMTGLGMFGIVGWSIAVPTLLGIALGVYLDRRYSQDFSWTLTLLFAGIVVGCFNAWHWVEESSKND
jgi:ATP synthase protein I